MALQKSTSIEVFGKNILFEEAYHQITMLRGNKDGLTMTVFIFDNQTKANKIQERNYFFIPSILEDAPNFYKQGYQHMKSLDEYADAVDVLEEGQTAS